jgi:hypothetical protein
MAKAKRGIEKKEITADPRQVLIQDARKLAGDQKHASSTKPSKLH